jgi:hypothetical protein
LVSGKVLPVVLGVSVEHKHLLPVNKIIDDPDSTPFPSASPPPANLTQAVRTRHEIASLRIDDELPLELGIRIIVDEVHDLLCENVSFIKDRPQ